MWSSQLLCLTVSCFRINAESVEVAELHVVGRARRANENVEFSFRCRLALMRVASVAIERLHINLLIAREWPYHP